VLVIHAAQHEGNVEGLSDQAEQVVRKRPVTIVRLGSATFTNAFPVSELNVWNRMANQALPGQLQPLTMPECLPVSGRSRPAHVQHLPSSATLAPVFP
jgi:hypothetical protein